MAQVFLYDTTLRDGAQGCDVNLDLKDKIFLAGVIDSLGIDYIEGGWPGSNPTDTAFFANPPKLRAKLMAFGMTRRPNSVAKEDPSLSAVLGASSDGVCLVGKSWDFHVKEILRCSLEENLAMIGDSLACARAQKETVMFDAEHFFDGYKENPEYTLACVSAALESGTDWVILCDTKGGTLPKEVAQIVAQVTKAFPKARFGIHCHNDLEVGVANSLAAVDSGARQIQGTINGIGERCGNTNLIPLIATLHCKEDYKTNYQTSVSADALTRLRDVAFQVGDRLSMPLSANAAFVGDNAFAHKGGLHSMAVKRASKAYEHIEPQQVGHKQKLLVSNQAGQSVILSRLHSLGFASYQRGDPEVRELLELVKEKEFAGYAYESADASLALLFYRFLGKEPNFFTVQNFRTTDAQHFAEADKQGGEQNSAESKASVFLKIGAKTFDEVETGNGPVHALDRALRKALLRVYPALKEVSLTDYKVRILSPEKAAGAMPRVTIESKDQDGNRWTTIGVSSNIIAASFEALKDAYIWKLLCDQKQA